MIPCGYSPQVRYSVAFQPSLPFFPLLHYRLLALPVFSPPVPYTVTACLTIDRFVSLSPVALSAMILAMLAVSILCVHCCYYFRSAGDGPAAHGCRRKRARAPSHEPLGRKRYVSARVAGRACVLRAWACSFYPARRPKPPRGGAASLRLPLWSARMPLLRSFFRTRGVTVANESLAGNKFPRDGLP